MVTNFKEICVKWYSLLLAKYFPEESQGRNFIKKSAYFVASFLAKRSGFLPFFFSNNEKKFNSLTITKQYEIVLENFTFHKSNELNQNESLKNITIVFSVGENSKQLERSFDSIIHQTFSNFNTIIICRESKDKSLENIINIKKSGHDKIVNIKKDTNLVDALNKIIWELDTEYVTFLDCTGILQPDSIRLASTILNKEKFDIIYADEDSIESDNVRTEPFFKPNWSPHLALSQDYIGKFIIYKTDLLKSINGFDNSLSDCNEYDLLLRAAEKSSRIHRISRVLFSNFKDISHNHIKIHRTAVQRQIDRKKIPAIVEMIESGYCKLIPKLGNTPFVSIIIPTKDNVSKLRRCLHSISKSTYENYEIIIISNSKNEKTWKFLHTTGHKILEYAEPFNFSKINNFAAKYAKGEYLLFLNDDTEVITRDWLESMLLYSMQHDVGVVGSLLLFPKSVFYESSIQHGGVSVGIAGPVNHSFSYCHYKEKNYYNFDKVVRNVSAVTAACMMIRREVFDKADGFDEGFAISFGDIDICLRIRHLGYQIVYNPNVMVYHYESSTRGILNPPNDDLLFITRWEDYIISGDEYYNPNLSHLARSFRTSPYFSQEPALSLLLEIYFLRTDLQQLFSNINDKIIELIDWAATKGVSSDFTRIALLPYNKYYRDKCSKKVSSLAEIIYEFNHNIEWQKKFPEVFIGRYERLYDIIKQRTLDGV